MPPPMRRIASVETTLSKATTSTTYNADAYATEAEAFIQRITAVSLQLSGYDPSPYNEKHEYTGAPIPRNEKERLQRLYRVHKLDHSTKVYLNTLTEMIKKSMQVPIVLVSLVEEDKQWFEAGHGLPVNNTARTLSFCAWTLLPDNPEVLEVIDAREHPWFKDNALVTGPPYLVAYTGVPLVSPKDGARYGSLCCIDLKPKKMSSTEIRQLQLYSKLVVKELEKNLQVKEEEVTHSYVLRAMDTFSDGLMLVVDKKGLPVVLTANKGWENITQYTAAETAGKALLPLLSREPSVQTVLAQLFAKDSSPAKPQIYSSALCHRKDGTTYWNHIRIFQAPTDFCTRTTTSHNTAGAQHWIVQVTDITEVEDAKEGLGSAVRDLDVAKGQQKQAIKQKSAFLANMSHELRTPLNSIIACSELMCLQGAEDASKSKDGGGGSAEDHLATNIHLEATQLLTLMDDILHFSRLEAKDSDDMAEEPLDVIGLMDSYMEWTRAEAAFKHKSIGYKMGQLDWNNKHLVFADYTYIHQILNNLLSNICKYVGQGEVSLLVRGIDTPKLPHSKVANGNGNAASVKGQSNLFIEIYAKDISPECCAWLLEADSLGQGGVRFVIVRHLVALKGGKLTMKEHPEGGMLFEFNIALRWKDTDGSVEQAQVRSVPEPLTEAEQRRTNLAAHRLVVVSANTISFFEPIQSFCALLGVCCEMIHISTTEQLNKLKSGLKGCEEDLSEALHSDSARAIVFLDEVSGIPGICSRHPGLSTSSTNPFSEEPSEERPASILEEDRGSDERRRSVSSPELRPRRTTTSTSATDICLQRSSTSATSVRSNISNISKVDFSPKVDALEDALTTHPRVAAVTRYHAAQFKSSKAHLDHETEGKMENKPLTFNHFQRVIKNIVNNLMIKNMINTEHTPVHIDYSGLRGKVLRETTEAEAALSRPLPKSRGANGGKGRAVPAAEQTSQFTRLQILLVDDTPMNLMVLQRMLGSIGVEQVVKVTNVSDARRIMLERKFKVVFMDIQMPDIDGFQACKMLRDDNPELDFRVVAMTASTETEALTEKAKLAGLDAILYKPLTKATLRDILEQFSGTLLRSSNRNSIHSTAQHSDSEIPPENPMTNSSHGVSRTFQRCETMK